MDEQTTRKLEEFESQLGILEKPYGNSDNFSTDGGNSNNQNSLNPQNDIQPPITEIPTGKKRRPLTIILIIIIATLCAIIGVIAAYYYSMYNDYEMIQTNYDWYVENYYTLEGEKQEIENEKYDLENQLYDASSKAEWFDESCKIVVADEGSLYKTYHTYDCSKWRGHRYWIYNKEQVINNSQYIKCWDCNRYK